MALSSSVPDVRVSCGAKHDMRERSVINPYSERQASDFKRLAFETDKFDDEKNEKHAKETYRDGLAVITKTSAAAGMPCREIKNTIAMRLPFVKFSLYPGKESPEKIYKGPDESTQNRYAGSLTENDQSDENKRTVTLQKVDQFFIPGRQQCG